MHVLFNFNADGLWDDNTDAKLFGLFFVEKTDLPDFWNETKDEVSKMIRTSILYYIASGKTFTHTFDDSGDNTFFQKMKEIIGDKGIFEWKSATYWGEPCIDIKVQWSFPRNTDPLKIGNVEEYHFIENIYS
jgi:hypothetical protein